MNADNSPDVYQSGSDQLEFIDSKFGEILPLVLKHAVLQDFSVLMFSKSRSWLVRQPSAKKVIKKILADEELQSERNQLSQRLNHFYRSPKFLVIKDFLDHLLR